jgi:hypothetical protein
VETANANNPHGEGPIDPKNFAPYPKNPAIARFFIQLCRVDKWRSGVLNVNWLIKSMQKAVNSCYKYLTLKPGSFFKLSNSSSPVINVAFFRIVSTAAKASA